MKTISALVAALVVAGGLALSAPRAVAGQKKAYEPKEETVYIPKTAADWFDQE